MTRPACEKSLPFASPVWPDSSPYASRTGPRSGTGTGGCRETTARVEQGFDYALDPIGGRRQATHPDALVAAGFTPAYGRAPGSRRWLSRRDDELSAVTERASGSAPGLGGGKPHRYTSLTESAAEAGARTSMGTGTDRLDGCQGEPAARFGPHRTMPGEGENMTRNLETSEGLPRAGRSARRGPSS